MKNLKSFLILFLFTGIVWQCRDIDKIITEPFTPPTSDQLNALFDDAVTNEKAFAHFFDSSNPNYVYTTPRGTTVTVNGTCLRQNGAPITGTAILEFVEIYDRATMAATNKPTMGMMPNGEEEMMLSGGEFYVNITKNGVPLTTTCPIKIVTKTSNTGGTVAGMQAFNGVITENQIKWEPTNSWEVLTNTQTNTYTLNVPGFGWFNCDKFSAFPNPKTTITANVPSGYGKVSQVFILTKKCA